MGTQIDATPEASDGATAFDAPGLSPNARANRARLAACLGAVGFVNYPTEWWHWSYGDRYWAFVDRATDGPVRPRLDQRPRSRCDPTPTRSPCCLRAPVSRSID